MATEVIAEYDALADASGPTEFGYRIISVVVLGWATVGGILKAIIAQLTGELIQTDW